MEQTWPRSYNYEISDTDHSKFGTEIHYIYHIGIGYNILIAPLVKKNHEG